MKIEGKFVKTLQKVEGETAKGPWVRGGLVIETFGDYPHKVAFTLFGEDKVAFTLFGEDKVAMADGLAESQPVEVVFMPESREFNGKWYTDLKASEIKPLM